MEIYRLCALASVSWPLAFSFVRYILPEAQSHTHSRAHSTHLSGAAAGGPEWCSPFAYAQR